MSSESVKILVVDDEPSQRTTLSMLLSKEGYEVVTAASAAEADRAMLLGDIDVVITDIRMPGETGLSLFRRVKTVDLYMEVILLTAFADRSEAIAALDAGAFAYLNKPYEFAELLSHIRRATEKRRISQENQRLQSALGGLDVRDRIVARSPSMIKILETVRRVADVQVPVLLTGESGVGKELIARRIHRLSSRADKPYLAVHGGAIPENLVEAEIFGYERGAFTGADKAKPGLVEAVQGGTLFLDEIGELPLASQVKLLRLLQDGSYRRVGATEDRQASFRLVAATNRRIESMIAEGTFREDLFFRLNVIRIDLPPLRMRREDIPLLAQSFLWRYNREHGKAVEGFSAEAERYLALHGFPGNIRELQNWIERSVILSMSPRIDPPEAWVPTVASADGPSLEALWQQVTSGAKPLDQVMADLEQVLLDRAMNETGGNQTLAAKMLHLSPRQFRYKYRRKAG